MLLHEVGHRVGDRLRPAFAARRTDPCTRTCGGGRRRPSARARLPIGSWIATQRSESCCRAASSTRKKSARSRSSMLTKRTRESSYSSARFHTRAVLTSTPITPLSTTTTPSTTRSAANVSAWKPASPGVSTRLILRSFHSRWQSEPERDMRALLLVLVPVRDRRPLLDRSRAGSSSPPGRAAPRRARSSRRRGGRRRRCCGSSRARWQAYGTCPPGRFEPHRIPPAWMKGAVHRPKIGACALSSASPCCSPSPALPLPPTAPLFRRANGSAIVFPGTVRAWCDAKRLNVFSLARRTPAVALAAPDRAEARPPADVSFGSAGGTRTGSASSSMTRRRKTRRRSGAEGSHGTVTLRRATCRRGGAVEIGLSGTIASEFSDGKPVRVSGTYRGRIGSRPG